MAEPEVVTRLLGRWSAGDRRALDELIPLVYAELRRLARGAMRGERPGHGLQTTALVHEAYVRLVGAELDLRDRAHFFALAARLMRRVLVDHAREEAAAKRGGGREQHVTLTDGAAQKELPLWDLLDLDAALERLAVQDERKSRALELHYFGGLNSGEIATVLDVAPATVRGDLRLARAWLRRELS
jgi:RNA polymerase sigma factor (TIGR02999 family)